MEDPMQRRMVSGSVPQFEEEEEEEDEPSQPPLRHINVGGSVGQTISASHMTSSTVGQTMPQLTVRRQSSTEDIGEPAKQRTRKQILPSTGNRGSAPGANVINVIGGTASKNSSGGKGTGNIRNTAAKAPKKEELPVIDKDAAANAQAQANQRIATPQGWRRMNEWISNITKELLLMPSVDTPKIVQKLSKTSADNEIKEKSAQLVRKWRKVATAKDARKTGRSSRGQEVAPQVVHPQTEVGILDKLKEEMSSDPLAKKPPAVPRPKTAKTKLSKQGALVGTSEKLQLSSGLEGDEDTSTSSTVAPVRRRAPLAASAKSLPFVRTTASTSGGIALAISPTSAVAPSVKPPLPKRSLMLSDSFMDELEDQAVVAKKPKIVRKKISQIAQPISPVETTVRGLYSDTSKPSTSFQPRKDSLEEENSAGSLAGEGVLPGRRRVRFADEHGSELVQVKFFEIEEGERINGFHMSALHDLPMPFNNRQPPTTFSINQSGVRWKLVPVDDVIELIEPGSQCEAKVIEARRRNTVMEAFYDATNPLQILEIDDCDYPVRATTCLL
uniref:TFIIS N-terminal domain-containing protein n=1 Tax=Ditylenchus dipsaci TaxID=166011 RepID=A0A915E0U2_9BILA